MRRDVPSGEMKSGKSVYFTISFDLKATTTTLSDGGSYISTSNMLGLTVLQARQ